MTASNADWDDLMKSLGLAPSASAKRETTPEERAANTARCREQRRRRAERGLSPDDPRHGKASTYTNWNCRCPRCTAANTEACVKASRDRRKSVAV